MSKDNKPVASETHSKVFERIIVGDGYTPVGKLDTSKPPKGGSGVPPKPFTQNSQDKK